MRLPSPSALAAVIAHPAAFLSGDTANIRRLAEQIGCSLDDATAVYRLARREGYPSAYRTVFGASGKGRRGIRGLQTRPGSIGHTTIPPRVRAGTASGRPG